MFLFCWQNFQLDAESLEVRGWIHWLKTERLEQTEQSLARARYYVPQLKEIFSEEGVPENLIWLVLIESGFRPHAVSPTGATGMFQFKKPTAEFLGLKTHPFDQRLDPFLSARASAQYLNYLRAKFDSWELTLAAYNLGEGDLIRLMRSRNLQLWPDLQPFVREETRHYVAKIKAAAVIGNRFMAEIKEQPLDLRRHTVVKGDTLYSLSKKFGTSVEALKKMNGLYDEHISLGQILLIPPLSEENP